MTSPLPPSAPDPGLSFIVSRVQVGQSFRDTVSVRDLVVVTALTAGGTELVTLKLSPEEAMNLGRALARKAGELINAEVDDDGKPTSTEHRLNRILGTPPTAPPTPYTPGWLGKAAQDLSDRIKASKVEGAMIEDANAARQAEFLQRDPAPVANSWVDEKLHRELHCPICHSPVFISHYPTDGPKAACSDPKCEYANGITPFPRQFRPAFQDEINAMLDGPKRVPFDATSDTDGNREVLTRKTKLRHNHFTRDIKQDGSCPACTDYINRHGIPEEEQ